MHVDNEKLGIYKSSMPKHNTRIMYAQKNAVESTTITRAPWCKNQHEASTSEGELPFGYVIW